MGSRFHLIYLILRSYISDLLRLTPSPVDFGVSFALAVAFCQETLYFDFSWLAFNGLRWRDFMHLINHPVRSIIYKRH